MCVWCLHNWVHRTSIWPIHTLFISYLRRYFHKSILKALLGSDRQGRVETQQRKICAKSNAYILFRLCMKTFCTCLHLCDDFVFIGLFFKFFLINFFFFTSKTCICFSSRVCIFVWDVLHCFEIKRVIRDLLKCLMYMKQNWTMR